MKDAINLPAPADRIMVEFISKISDIEPNFLEGVYLTGSIAMNDFYAGKSDIDFLVLCKTLPEKRTAARLHRVHQTIARHYSKPNMSGSYLAADSLLTAKPEDIKVLSFHQGAMRYGTFEMAAVSLSELKSHAITILGPKAETLKTNIEPAYLTGFLYTNINSYWAKWIKRHSSWFNRKLLLLLFPRFTEWSVLGVARQLCTLHTGKIVSKTEAGLYCLQQLPDKFHPIIREAIKIRKDNRTYPFVKSYAIKASLKRLMQTIKCVDYMIFNFNLIYNEQQD